MHQHQYKKWFIKRHSSTTLDHYKHTASQVQQESYIDQMFQKLDADGGGTLSIDEIKSLFVENGINMTKDAVAEMFANAIRMDLTEKRRQQLNSTRSSNIQTHQLVKKSPELNKKMQYSPDQFKTISLSQASVIGKSTIIFDYSDRDQ